MAQAQGQRGVISGHATEAFELTGPRSKQHEVVDEDDCCSHRLSDGLSTVERVTTDQSIHQGQRRCSGRSGSGQKAKNTAHTGGEKRSPSSLQAKKRCGWQTTLEEEKCEEFSPMGVSFQLGKEEDRARSDLTHLRGGKTEARMTSTGCGLF